ncbi:MAG TPA: hypothetical protein VFW85_05745 [Gaiellaceae bacterium]|nr:hypothetical protein [Gaiellaceae bacterium]
MLKKLPLARFLVALVASGVIAGGAYAFTAANTVPATNVGAGSGTVSGYTVSNIHYSLDSTSPTNIDSLTFSVSPAIPNTGSGTVEVQAALTSGGPNSYSCTTNTAGDTVTCATTSPQLTAATLSSLTVVAAQ